MRLAADAGSLGLWTWDPIADCVEPENDRAYEIFGLPPSGDALNAACLVRDYLHEEDVPAFQRAAALTLGTGAPFFFQGRIYRQPDRELRWVELNGRLQPAWNGHVAQIIGTTADITSRKQAEAQERQAVAAAFAAAEASAKFRTFFEQAPASPVCCHSMARSSKSIVFRSKPPDLPASRSSAESSGNVTGGRPPRS